MKNVLFLFLTLLIFSCSDSIENAQQGDVKLEPRSNFFPLIVGELVDDEAVLTLNINDFTSKWSEHIVKTTSSANFDINELTIEKMGPSHFILVGRGEHGKAALALTLVNNNLHISGLTGDGNGRTVTCTECPCNGENHYGECEPKQRWLNIPESWYCTECCQQGCTKTVTVSGFGALGSQTN